MKKKIERIKLYINDNEESYMVAKDLEMDLKKYGFEVVDSNEDLAISIGGDGSFLRMVKENNFNDKIYYIGVNSGTLGFLQEINVDEIRDFVKRISIGKYKVDEVSIQETKVITNDEIYVFNSLNEIVIRSKYFNTLKIPVYVDDELLEDFSGDGLLISTSTGSTAYNMSFFGSIIYPTLRTLSITPIAPLNSRVYKSLTNSIVIPDNCVVSLPTYKNYNDIYFMVDGVNKEINNVIKIESKVGKKTIKVLRMNNFHFIKVVNNKILGK